MWVLNIGTPLSTASSSCTLMFQNITIRQWSRTKNKLGAIDLNPILQVLFILFAVVAIVGIILDLKLATAPDSVIDISPCPGRVDSFNLAQHSGLHLYEHYSWPPPATEPFVTRPHRKRRDGIIPTGGTLERYKTEVGFKRDIVAFFLKKPPSVNKPKVVTAIPGKDHGGKKMATGQSDTLEIPAGADV
ncbi:MAG: hypothetical protein JOS17DRAFT_781523 [Linnemannia elongata]|nr:MAG: hypothetical protein JOS17DRAFT_781523 [Linnemannia elongata]